MKSRLILLLAVFAASLFLHGQAPDAKQEFVRSLTLRADRIIADSTHPSIVWLAQTNHGARRLFEFFNAHAGK